MRWMRLFDWPEWTTWRHCWLERTCLPAARRRDVEEAPAYDELSSHFGVLEAAAEESGNRDAAFYLTKAKMAMIAAHSAKRVRQADMREFVAT